MLKYLNHYFESMNNQSCFLFSLSLSILLGILDYLIGPELSFSVFYIIPIMLGTWYDGKVVGFSITLVSATIWLGADLAAGNKYINTSMEYTGTLNLFYHYFKIIVNRT